MRLQALMLLGCAAAAAQDSQVASDANQVLEQLIRDTSDPGSFRASYRSEASGEAMTVLFEYEPDGRLHMLAESIEGRMESWIDGSTCTMLGKSPQGLVWASVDWASPVLEQPLEVRDGKALVPSRPGSGIVWNEQAVERFRVA